MKTIYTRPICPACHVLKAQLKAKGEVFEAITVVDDSEPRPPGAWVSREAFNATHPGVRSFPFVVEGGTT